MLRWIIVGLAMLAGSWLTAGAASAQECKYAVGDYVGQLWVNEILPAIVLAVEPNCYYSVRQLSIPGRDDNFGAFSSWEKDLSPLAGPPPYDKPNGCPWQAGDEVDFNKFYSDLWFPGTVVAADADCGFSVTYLDLEGKEVRVSVSQFDSEYLRARSPAGVDPAPLFDTTKKFGCLYEAGDRIDFRDEDELWYPGVMLSATNAGQCEYTISYSDAAGVQTRAVIAHNAIDRLRELGTVEAAVPVCDPLPPADYGSDTEEGLMLQSITTAFERDVPNLKELIFSEPKLGNTIVSKFGEPGHIELPADAPDPVEIRPIRFNAVLCTEADGTTVTKNMTFDFLCYEERFFGELVCQQRQGTLISEVIKP